MADRVATFKIDGPDVAPGGSSPTVVNITLRQESGVAYLCKGAVALMRRHADAKDADATPLSRGPRQGEQKVLGGAQILLGIVCIGIGVVLSMAASVEDAPYYYKRAFYNGVPFWSGGLFILSGSFSVIGARHGGKWVHLATLLNLGSIVAGSVSFAVGLAEFPSPMYRPYFIESLCKGSEDYRSYRPWERTTVAPYDSDQGRVKQCRETLWAFVLMWSSTHILLLILHSAALALALFCFGDGLRRLCCSCWGGWQEYVAMEDAETSEEPIKE